jgi:hypothetical protein
MSEDAELEVIANIKEADIFAIHLDESNDITGKAQLLEFSAFVMKTSLNSFYSANHSQKQ